ncbi:hypothetical protein BDN70DRAFT_712342 [Pholiota conissans]|uniref:Uncharacterized protein n=1 Tax=Pholiota conissans TaxID=109636 RepID=A0A9P5YKD4_9AGAR|nr:hypothetical protein BDN70DRAFT_712342 [Pholiota conissans]
MYLLAWLGLFLFFFIVFFFSSPSISSFPCLFLSRLFSISSFCLSSLFCLVSSLVSLPSRLLRFPCFISTIPFHPIHHPPTPTPVQSYSGLRNHLTRLLHDLSYVPFIVSCFSFLSRFLRLVSAFFA